MDPAGLDRLLQRARRSDPEALDALFGAYHRRVFGLLRRMTGRRETAEDLLQETFLRVVRTIETYEHQGRFDAWLFRIAANLARDHARRMRRRRTSIESDVAAFEDDPAALDSLRPLQHEPDREIIRDEAGARLNAGLDRLAEMDREIILLRHFSELSFREIADMLDIPLGTALARAHRALKRLKAEFPDEE